MSEARVQPASEPDIGALRSETIGRFFAAIQEGDYAVLRDVLTPDAITRWPQSGERISGAMACVRVYENYPGGPPAYAVQRISGEGRVWVAELAADYGDERWRRASLPLNGARNWWSWRTPATSRKRC